MNNIQVTPIASNIINLSDYRRRNALTPSIITQLKDVLIEEVKSIINEWKEEITVTNQAIESTINFINKLPYNIGTPSISIENQDAILFEWSKKINDEQVGVFSVIIEKDRVIYSTYNLNPVGEETRGVLNMSTPSINIISNIISEYFGEYINNAQRNRHSL